MAKKKRTARKRAAAGATDTDTPTVARRDRWLTFLRETSGLKLTRAQRSRLYRNWRESGGTGPVEIRADPLVPDPLRDLRHDMTAAQLLRDLRHDMTAAQLCDFISRVVPLGRLGYVVAGIVGSGSYGLVLQLISSVDGCASVMKVSRVAEKKKVPVRFPVLNNQRTSWHTITFHEFERGVRGQQEMRARFRDVRIPAISHAGCVSLGGDERLGIIVMEKIEGDTLKKTLAKASVTDDVKRVLVRKAAGICARFHRKGCIHGDDHTWNMICDPSGHLHVIDFDRCSVSSAPEHRLHDVGMMLDTLDSVYWPIFIDAYFSRKGAANPFVVRGGTEAERKKDMHRQSRALFRKYLRFLASGADAC